MFILAYPLAKLHSAYHQTNDISELSDVTNSYSNKYRKSRPISHHIHSSEIIEEAALVEKISIKI